MPQDLRIIMLGTGDFALPTFEHLCETGHDVVALFCQPDRPQGRKQELIPSRIKLAAEARGVPVHQPESINAPEGVALLQSLAPDLLVTAAYGQILSAEVLGVPRLGGINLHGSALPWATKSVPAQQKKLIDAIFKLKQEGVNLQLEVCAAAMNGAGLTKKDLYTYDAEGRPEPKFGSRIYVNQGAFARELYLENQGYAYFEEGYELHANK